MGCRHQHGVVDGGDEPRSRRAWRQNDATLSGHGLESDRAARTFQAQPQRISSIQPPAANQGAGFLEWLKKYTRQTPIKNDFFQSTVRASIRNQRPRNTCKHQRNPSVFSMKSRVYKPQKKMGGNWDSNGGSFSLPFFFINEITQNPGSLRCVRLIRGCSLRIRARGRHFFYLLYCPVYSRIRKWGPGPRLVRGASRAASGLGFQADTTLPGAKSAK